MSKTDIYVDLDFQRVSQILGARVHNVTTTESNALAATLSGANTGLVVYDTTEKQLYMFDAAEHRLVQIHGVLLTRPDGFEVSVPIRLMGLDVLIDSNLSLAGHEVTLF